MPVGILCVVGSPSGELLSSDCTHMARPRSHMCLPHHNVVTVSHCSRIELWRPLNVCDLYSSRGVCHRSYYFIFISACPYIY